MSWPWPTTESGSSSPGRRHRAEKEDGLDRSSRPTLSSYPFVVLGRHARQIEGLRWTCDQKAQAKRQAKKSCHPASRHFAVHRSSPFFLSGRMDRQGPIPGSRSRPPESLLPSLSSRVCSQRSFRTERSLSAAPSQNLWLLFVPRPSLSLNKTVLVARSLLRSPTSKMNPGFGFRAGRRDLSSRGERVPREKRGRRRGTPTRVGSIAGGEVVLVKKHMNYTVVTRTPHGCARKHTHTHTLLYSEEWGGPVDRLPVFTGLSSLLGLLGPLHTVPAGVPLLVIESGLAPQVLELV